MKYYNQFARGNYSSGIYCIKTENNKEYYGSSVSLKTRYMTHRRQLELKAHHNIKIQNHVNKYGVHSLSFHVIELCDKAQLIEREQHYIDTLSPELNIARVAGATYGLTSWLGKKHSDATKEKIKQSNLLTFSLKQKKEKRIRISKEENIKRFAQLNKTPERRKILSELQKGNKHWLGKKHSEATKEKMSGEGNGRARKIFCTELNMNFACGKYAAVYFDVCNSAIVNSIKRRTKIKHKYTLIYE